MNSWRPLYYFQNVLEFVRNSLIILKIRDLIKTAVNQRQVSNSLDSLRLDCNGKRKFTTSAQQMICLLDLKCLLINSKI